MPTMGEVLRESRQRRNLSVEQAEEDTKIRKKYLVALEEDDYSELPPPVYARGFLQIYAEYLGLDPRFVEKLYQPPARAAAAPEIRPAATGLRGGGGVSFRGVATFALALLGIAAIIYLYVQYAAYATNAGEPMARRPTPVASATSLALVPPPSPTPTVVPTPSPTPVRGVEVLVQITERSWMRVIADGQSPPLFEGELNPGDTRVWKARDRIDMRVGNAGGVEVTVNGMRQGKLGASGEVKNVTWGRQ